MRFNVWMIRFKAEKKTNRTKLLFFRVRVYFLNLNVLMSLTLGLTQKKRQIEPN